MSDVLFILFSTLEALAIYTIMLTIFRYNVFDYIKQLLPISFLMSLCSYSVWSDFELSSYAPVISVFILIFFIFLVLRTSLIGAVLVAVKGYIAYAVVQTIALAILQLSGLISLERVQANKPDLYILQITTAIILFVISFFLFRARYGFSYSLNRFKWKGEGRLVLGILIAGIAFIAGISLFRTTLFLAAAILAALLFFLIYLSLREEKR